MYTRSSFYQELLYKMGQGQRYSALDSYFALAKTLDRTSAALALASAMKKKKPHFDRGVCIHCFCCQEFCPKGAMRQGRHAIMKILGK